MAALLCFLGVLMLFERRLLPVIIISSPPPPPLARVGALFLPPPHTPRAP